MSMIPHVRPSHLARGVSSSERKRGRMMGGRNSLSIRLLHGLLEAEGDMARVSCFKARIDREGEGLGKDLFGRFEAIEAEVAMQGVKDWALCLDALSMQVTYDLV
jgi:hypothetical protein